MYLKKLEIQGFKSFADKTIFEFRPGITTVIGPNGSGKSNVSDSIRWVLGEQRAKSLRGGKMEDIIFTGTQNRKALNFAEVTLTLDNSEGKLPVNFSEVAVTRRVYRSGESEYFINRSACRLKDIVELFMGTGIGRDGYSIIGQGRIDEILSNNSEERRNVFEEAAGISKYKARKIEAEKKLELTTQNLTRINDIIKELDSQLAPLKSQSEKAQKYLTLCEQLKVLEINLFLYESEKLKSQIEQVEAHLVELNQELELKMKNSEGSINKKAELKEKINEFTEQADLYKKIIFEKRNSIEKINSELSLFSEKISNNTLSIERLKSEIQENIAKIQELNSEKAKRTEKIETLRTQKLSYSNYLAEKEEELSKIIATLTDEELKIENMKTSIIDFMNEKSEIKSKLNATLTMKNNAINRDEQITNKLSNTVSENDKLKMQLEDDNDALSSISRELKEISEKFQSTKNEELNFETQLKSLEKEVYSISSEINIKTTKHKLLSDTEKNNEGYFRSVKVILDECEKNKEFSKGICGSLAKLISVEEQYEVALEVALGSNLQNIVTESQEDAKKAIEFLKEKNAGRATFFPINSYKPSEELKNIDKISKCAGFIGIGTSLIKFNNKYENILSSLLGKTVIVDTLENAVNLSKQNLGSYRIVSLAGDVVNTAGSMSGGSQKVKTDSLLSRGRIISELEKEIEELNKTLKNTTSSADNINEEYKKVKQSGIELSEEFRKKEVLYASEKEKLSSLQNTINQNEEKIKNIKIEKSQLSVQISEFTGETTKLEKEITEIDEKISAIQVDVEKFKQNNKEKMEIRDNLAQDITNYKISISSFDESEASINEIIDRVDNDINETENSNNKKNEEINILSLEIEKLKNTQSNSSNKIDEINNEILDTTSKLEEIEKEKNSLNDALTSLEELMGDDIRAIEDAKNKISKEEMKKMKLDLDFENINNKIWEDYEITYSSALALKQDLGNPSKISSSVANIKNDIKNLGSINVDSIEEYKNVNERFNFMSAQKQDLTDSEEKLKKVINDMISTMKKEFLEKFSIINDNFKVVFAELFNGGTANIKLCDESNVLESGIDIEVQPPGKKLQNMMLLSGGERALTAIALLFSILKINPSPFCVLDEIEAALDDVNVYRFADYVKKFSDSIQFIIITHRKGTMEAANTVYGITMEEKGISKLVSMKLDN